MVKVLNIISDTNIGGAGRVLLNYLKYSDRARFKTTVCLPKGSLLAQPLRELGADVVEADISSDASFSLKDIGALKSVIRRVNPDIVHTHGSLSGRIAARNCGKIVIYTRHSVFPVSASVKNGPGRLANKLINEHYADRIIAVSPAAKQNLTDAGIRPDRIDVVMNGVEPVERKTPEACAKMREQAGVGFGDFVLGILARLEPYKGHLDILEAVKILKDEGRPVKLLIAGKGPFEPEIRKRADALGLGDAVVFLGFVTDVSSVLSILSVQLNASWGTEATSLSLLEGMSLGLPAVVSDYGGNPYLIEDGANGLVFKTRDTADLAACVRRLMDDGALMENIRRRSAEIFFSRYTGRIFAENIERIYSETLKGVKDGK